MEEKEKYYYFPTCVTDALNKKIGLIRGEKYVCLSTLHYRLGSMLKNNIYIVDDFENNNWRASIDFRDELGKIYRVSPWDIGNFTLLKQQRKNKLKRLNEFK